MRVFSLCTETGVEVLSTSPGSGPVTGDTLLQVIGTTFVDTGMIAVRFQNSSHTLITNGTYVNSTLILCRTPSFATLLPSAIVTVEIALNGQQFTGNNVTFMYYGVNFWRVCMPIL